MLCEQPLLNQNIRLWIQDINEPNELKPAYYTHLSCVQQNHNSKIKEIEILTVTVKEIQNSDSHISYPIYHHTERNSSIHLVPYLQ